MRWNKICAFQGQGDSENAKEKVPYQPKRRRTPNILEKTSKGKINARQMKRALILLKANEGKSDPEIMAALNVSRPCVERIRKRFVEGGMGKDLNEDPRPGFYRKLDGRGEAILLATACSVPLGA